MISISLFMGGDDPSSAVVQTAGESLSPRARRAQGRVRRGGAMQRLMLRYTRALIAQMTRRRCAAAITRWSSSSPVTSPTLDRVPSGQVMTRSSLPACWACAARHHEPEQAPAGRLHPLPPQARAVSSVAGWILACGTIPWCGPNTCACSRKSGGPHPPLPVAATGSSQPHNLMAFAGRRFEPLLSSTLMWRGGG